MARMAMLMIAVMMNLPTADPGPECVVPVQRLWTALKMAMMAMLMITVMMIEAVYEIISSQCVVHEA